MNLPKLSLKGAFITFEGIDGCGKSTQARSLVERLKAGGYVTNLTWEPGGTVIGGDIRKILLNPLYTEMLPSTELLLYLADRVQHIQQEIIPARARGEVVICDRFHDATEAYQRYGREIDFGPFDKLIQSEIAPHLPQTTFWLDVSLETAQARIKARNLEEKKREDGASEAENRLENERSDFFKRVRAGYGELQRLEPQRIVIMDAEKKPEQLEKEIWEVLEARYAI